jgi:hypothetical protein
MLSKAKVEAECKRESYPPTFHGSLNGQYMWLATSMDLLSC